jgi:NADH-quinone oxidoreductase subunit H
MYSRHGDLRGSRCSLLRLWLRPIFFLGEYLGMFSIAGFAITLFLGGWGAPLSVLQFIPSWAWFFAKLLGAIFFFIWLRGTLPRLRQDQLMNFAWKFMLPMTLLNLLVAAAWRFFDGGWIRWIVCSAVLGIAYVLLGRVLMRRQGFGARSYRYAE